jgi:Zn-dependent peptidase ImmA (M78 family)
MALRRGFKAEANQIAREVREELGLRWTDPLDPWALARHLEIPVIPLSRLASAAPDAVQHFHRVDRGAFSALTVFDGPRRLIVYNDSHSGGRRASDLAHEIAHALLLHRPGPAFDQGGCRRWDGEQEEEANWLAAALLISEEAALHIARTNQPVDEAARQYGVSQPMVAFRLNVTGALRRVGVTRGLQAPTRRTGSARKTRS